MGSGNTEPSVGEGVGRVGSSVIRLVSILEDKGELSDDEIDEILEPINDFVDKLDFDDDTGE